MRRLAVALLVTHLACPAHAQELLGVNFAGQAFAVNTATGQSRLVGATGSTFCNAMARQGGVLYASVRNGQQHLLVTIDPITAVASVRFANLGVDLRGLADSPVANELFGIVNGTNDADRLVRVNLTTGAVTNVGSPMRRTGIQALTRRNGVLLAWDVQAGLLRIDQTAGNATDISASVGTNGADVQFLATDEQGRLFGGSDQLFSIDAATGLPTTIGAPGIGGLRGAELHRGTVTSYGQGCPFQGAGTVLQASTTGLAGAPLLLFSSGHAPFAVGTLFTSPELKTSIFPGSNCLLLVRTDFGSIPVVADAAGGIAITTTLTGQLGAELFLQLVTQEPVAGSIVTMTQGLHVRVPR